MSRRDWRILLEDILECIEKAERYTAGKNAQEFSGSSMLIDAVVRNLEIIGEAAGRVPAEIQEGNPRVPWTQLVGLRNRIVHEYFGVDVNIVWHIVVNELPTLKSSIRDLLER